MKLGYEYKIIKDNYWKVVIFYNNKELYYYIFDTEEEVKNKLKEFI